MVKITKEAALRYHEQGRPGKIEIVPTKPYRTETDLSLAYSPGVAEPCLEIQKNPHDAYRYTNKGNLVAVISNGTAVLGLGDIGAMAGKPVMEGKSLLFKIYAGVDAFDIEVGEKDPDKFIEAVKAIAPTFGGINLEDIKAPECFEIERRLKEELDIPVMHDDQHGTAIISAAGLLNALEVAGKDIAKVKIVVNGAGAAAISCTRLYCSLGARKENIVMLDSKGVITSDRPNLTEQKREFATERRDVHTLAEAMVGADVFVGLSKGNVLTPDMVRASSINTAFTILVGLCVSNCLTALSGAVLAQYQRSADINLGTGMVVIGLASLIIGETIFARGGIWVKALGAVGGSILYRFIIALALRANVPSECLKLLSAVIVGLAIAMPAIRAKAAFARRRAAAKREGGR